jgi:Family of unknown function (DUF6521)
MKRWDQRPFEIKNLFNPAFCGVVLFRALLGYEEENPEGIPFSLALLVLPLCLQQDSRQLIAGNSRSYLLKVAEMNPQLLVGFAGRVSDMLPFTFVVSPDGRLRTVPDRIRKKVAGTDESVSCQRVARFVGKEFARIAHSATVYRTFGIRP